MKDKTFAFIDGTNLHNMCEASDVRLNYKRLLDFLCEQGQFVRAYYYTALPNRNVSNPIFRTMDWMEYNGYTIVSKELKTFQNGDVETRKGNMDVEMAVDMMEMAPYMANVFLFTGDGDFCHAILALKRQGVRVIVVAATPESTIDGRNMCSDKLRRTADEFIEVAELAKEIEYGDEQDEG